MFNLNKWPRPEFYKNDVLMKIDRLRKFESENFKFNKHNWRLLSDTR